MCKGIRNHIDEIELCPSEQFEITSTAAYMDHELSELTDSKNEII